VQKEAVPPSGELSAGGTIMETRSVQQQAKGNPANPALLKSQHQPVSATPDALPQPPQKIAGYGLPCSKCRVYYPADMNVCPICKSSERIAPAATGEAVQAAPAAAQKPPLEDERERLLKELKSQFFASHNQINTAATFRCCLDHKHNGNVEPAAVCHTCYGEMRQQADRLEAALHIDLKEAAQIVYDAVWSDPSNPGKTYQNAAAALLLELRKRAGIGVLLGSHQSLSH
jgi:hypothetical protein